MRLEDQHGPPLATRPEALGTVMIEGPASIVADSYTKVAVVYTAGALGVDDGGQIRVALRHTADFEPPQFDDPTAPDYCSVSAEANVVVTPTYDSHGGERPFWKAVIVRVTEGSLAPGDKVRLTFGDTSGGSPGWRAQTFAETRCVFLTAVDPVRTGMWQVLPERPAMRIVNGPATRLVAILPTEAAVDESFALFIRAEDRWGNVARDFAGEVELAAIGSITGLPHQVSLETADRGCREVAGPVAFEPGIVRIRARADGLGEAVSNPLIISDPDDTSPLRPHWGDLHGQSGETIGVGTVGEYFDFARRAARLDFASHQGNCFQISDDKWRGIVDAARQANDPGRFVTFPGYEWSANEYLGGDHNVFFLDEDQPILRAHQWLTGAAPLDEGTTTATDLYAALDPARSIVSHHIGGRPGNLDFFAGGRLEPFIEVHSCWGTFEFCWREALERGLKVGFVCGSDDHKGRPGAAHPGRGAFGCYGGLVCAFAERLDRASLWNAFKARRVYGTTGARIGVRFTCQGEPMGSEVTVRGEAKFEIEVAGTAAIEAVELWRAPLRPPEERDNPAWRGDMQLIERYVPWDDEPRTDDVLRVTWGGARRRGRRRAAVWDGHLDVTGARIRRAEPYGFVPPLPGIEEVEEHALRWRSTTTGGRHGVVLDLDALSGSLAFHTPLFHGRWDLSEVTRKSRRVAIGGVDLHVEVQRLPRAHEVANVALTMTDTPSAPGACAYGLRVVQVDGHKAWTSPIFVAPSEKEPETR